MMPGATSLHAAAVELNRRLLASDSATTTLQTWCVRRDGQVRAITARVLATGMAAVDEPRCAHLGNTSDVPVAYRRVQLLCAGTVLSEADNWYLPQLLTPAMNGLLASTDLPFGLVVRELGLARHTITARLLVADDQPSMPPDAPVLEHHAVLRTRDGQAVAEVREAYLRRALDVAFGESSL